jgi:hypothetical protein
MVGVKKLLLGLMLFGAVTYFGGGGTWASFSAETSNNGSTIASGTLTMTDTVNGNTGTTCLSANGASQNNINPLCDKLFTLTNIAPGVFGGTAKIAIQNTGSIDASKLSFWASSVNATLGVAGLVNGASISSIPVASLEGNVANGDQLVVNYGSHTQTFTAVGATAGSATATTIGITPATVVNFTYPAGTPVTDISSNSGTSNTDCFDAKTTVGTGGSSFGTQLNFNPTATNPLCGALVMSVQEQTGGLNYCWLGKGSGTSPQASAGACVAPVSVTLTTALTTGGSGPTALAVGALNGNVTAGDSVLVTSGTHTQTFVASATAYYGATSISITQTPANFAYPIGSSVVDSTSLTALNSNIGTTTVTGFDTANNTSGKIFMPPLTANGTSDATATVQLPHFGGTDTRTFYVSIFLPNPTGSVQNQLQGLSSTFGITWHLDQ